ncbi:MAG: tetratricopeptide repeat protein, partial [Deltaproteobacteria bacterium]|nr:tetratricopeptide repeat protein [Deltaproteobacteria bacterium]
FADANALYHEQKKSGRFDYEALLASYESALEKDPKLAEAHYNIGCIHEAMRNDKKAQTHYKKALEIRPDLAPAAANWGALLARKGRLDQALLVYKRALSKEAKNSAVLLNMASIYQKQKKFDLALKKSSDVLIRDPGNVGAYRIMASLYFDKGELDMAHLICLRGLTVKEEDPRLLNTLGLVLLKLKKVPEALAQFRGALKKAPDMVATRFNVAKIALDYKDFRIAREEFDKILQYEPENRKAAIGLGIALRGANKYPEAKAHFEALANRYEKWGLPHYWSGLLALRNFNDLKTAEAEFKIFIKLSGSRLSSDHPVFGYAKEIKMSYMAEKQMKAMEKRAEKERIRQEAFEKKLADERVKKFDEAWAKAEKEGGVLPPARLKPRELPFILLPPAVLPTQKTKVRLFGMVFKGVKKVEIGNLKTKWRQVNKTTLEIIAPKGLGLGAWDIMVTYKDKHEDPMLFVGGLWVGNKPKQKPKPKDEKALDKGTPKDKKGPGKDKAAKDKESSKAKEPDDKKGVKGGKPGDTGKKAKGKKPADAEPKEPDEPKESGEPKEGSTPAP